jgi:hypothetical protein
VDELCRDCEDGYPTATCHHGPGDVVRDRMSVSLNKQDARIAELEAQLLDSARAIQEGIALAAQLGKDGAGLKARVVELEFQAGIRNAEDGRDIND